MTIFKTGDFTFHSGSKSNFKIDLDGLTDEDWAALAKLIPEKVWYKFGKVVGVPRGGLKLASALESYITPESNDILIVDDVLTTGKSMEEKREELRKQYPGAWIFGVVVFSRISQKVPNWVYPLFKAADWLAL